MFHRELQNSKNSSAPRAHMYKIGDCTNFLLARIQCSLISFRRFSCSCLRCIRGCTNKHTRTDQHNVRGSYEWSHLRVATIVGKAHQDEGLVVQGGVGLLHPHTLLLVLLQSQRVDGEEGHVGLEHKQKV